MKVLITGASGLVGLELQRELLVEGVQCVPMVRNKSKTGVYWNPEQLEIDLNGMEGADALIHLAGENISAQRWTASFKEKIRSSRVEATNFLARSLHQLKSPPKHFLCASAVGFYGDGGDGVLDENSPAGSSFLSQVCVDWEKAAQSAPSSIRLAQMRIGVILSSHGGALHKMLPAFRMGLGGPLGSGDQFLPWIDLEDVVRAMIFVLKNPALEGAVNVTGPDPVRQKDFAKCLAHLMHRPNLIPMPAWMLRAIAGEMADELLLASLRAVPSKLSKAGFQFKYQNLEQSLSHWV